MPSLRRHLARLLFRDEVGMLHESIAALADARHWVRADRGVLSNPSQPARLGELDNRYADLLMDLAGYVPIGGVSSFQSVERLFNEQMRQRAVTASRLMAHNDVLISRAISIWTDFGFGQHVTVTPNDPALKIIFNRFWRAPRNRAVLGDAVIQENSDNSIRDGELFWVVWVSMLDGEATIRRLSTESVRAIIPDPDDPDTPLWYVRAEPEGDVYYPDWRAEPEALARAPIPDRARSADSLRALTRVVVIPIQRNKIGQRGWPQTRQALTWAQAYDTFIRDRATVAKKAAMYVEKMTAKNTNQRGVDNIIATLQSSLVNTGYGPDRNANTVAGQTWVQNEQVDREWMSRDTGAQGAQIDGITIMGQGATGMGVPINWLGRPDAMQNNAVAKDTNLPWYEQAQRYQTFWSAAFSDLVEVVGRFANEYGRQAISDFSAEVGLDSPFQNDIEEITALLGAVNSAGLDAAVSVQVNTALVDMALKALGVRDTEALLEAPELPVAAPGTETGMPAGDIAPVALNGAQVQAALAVVSQVTSGELTYDQGLNALQIMFGMTAAQAAQLLVKQGVTPATAPARGPSELVRAALALEAATAELARENELSERSPNGRKELDHG